MTKLTDKLLIIFILLLTAACAPTSPAPPETPAPQRLRIANVGDTAIVDLTVLFPGTATTAVTRIHFGRVEVGQMTAYQEIPSGVYRYAAYEYTMDGETVHQPVMDWVGERPLAGQQFTYQLARDGAEVIGRQMQLVEVLMDG